MNKRKAIVATTVIGLLTFAIALCLFLLKYMIGFFIITGVFALYGFSTAICMLGAWLLNDDNEESEKEAFLPVKISKRAEIKMEDTDDYEDEYYDDEPFPDVDGIIEEIRGLT